MSILALQNVLDILEKGELDFKIQNEAQDKHVYLRN